MPLRRLAKKFTKTFDTKKRILFGAILLIITYALILINQPIAALLMVFAFFLTLGLYKFGQ